MNRDNRQFNKFNGRRYNYNNQTIEVPINREVRNAMNSISRSIKSINAMGYNVRADQHTLTATRRQTRSTPQHSGGSNWFNRPTSSSSSNNYHNDSQYFNPTDRSIEIRYWANSLLSATTGWNRAFAHLELSPLTPEDREIYQNLISKLGVTRGQLFYLIDMDNLRNRSLRDANIKDAATQTNPDTNLTDEYTNNAIVAIKTE